MGFGELAVKPPVNIGGRSSITKDLQKILDQEVTVKDKETGQRFKRTRRELLAKVWYLQAMDGSWPAIQEIIAREDGKVPDRIAGADGGAIQADVISATLARIYPSEPQQVAVIEVNALPAPPEETKHDDA